MMEKMTIFQNGQKKNDKHENVLPSAFQLPLALAPGTTSPEWTTFSHADESLATASLFHP